MYLLEENFSSDNVQAMIPFAVVGSERNVIVDGQPVRGRKTRWGVINVENEQHCEFNYLRNFLTRLVPPSALQPNLTTEPITISGPTCRISSRCVFFPPFDSCKLIHCPMPQDYCSGEYAILFNWPPLILVSLQLHYETFRSKQLLALKESSKQAHPSGTA